MNNIQEKYKTIYRKNLLGKQRIYNTLNILYNL